MSSTKKKTGIKKAEQDETPENIIRQHRRYTYWVEGRSILGEGSLVLTDHRLLFLNRVESSPEVTAAIRKLADAPIRDVLDHALSLHKNSFQIPLSSIIRAGISMVTVFPQPRFCLSLYYLKGKKPAPHTENFMFKNARSGIFAQPQLFTAMSWSKTIREAI
jgi:hypothetical protein